MLCESCKERDAVVSVTRVENDGVTQHHLCEVCAAAQGVETTIATPKHPLGEFLQAVQQQAAVGQGGATSEALEDARCSFCNSTMADFRETGRWGCARCYTYFEGPIRELLRRVQGNHRHVGRPYTAPAGEHMERAALLGELRDRLRRAVEAEQFELAAELRDRIRGLE